MTGKVADYASIFDRHVLIMALTDDFWTQAIILSFFTLYSHHKNIQKWCIRCYTRNSLLFSLFLRTFSYPIIPYLVLESIFFYSYAVYDFSYKFSVVCNYDIQILAFLHQVDLGVPNTEITLCIMRVHTIKK